MQKNVPEIKWLIVLLEKEVKKYFKSEKEEIEQSEVTGGEFMNMMFDLFYLIFPVMFLLIFGMILFTFISGIRTWNKNNNSPRLTVEARVASKRQNTTHHNEPVGGDTSGTHGYHTTTSTSYYVTFEVESGDRMEFSVYGKEYGMLAEGDEGKLTFQGSRYLGFERAIEK